MLQPEKKIGEITPPVTLMESALSSITSGEAATQPTATTMQTEMPKTADRMFDLGNVVIFVNEMDVADTDESASDEGLKK